MRFLPSFHGQFYPDRPDELAETVDTGTDTTGALAPLLGFLSACTRGGYEL